MYKLALVLGFLLGLAVACAGGYGLHSNLVSLGHLVAFLAIMALGGVTMLFTAVRM